MKGPYDGSGRTKGKSQGKAVGKAVGKGMGKAVGKAMGKGTSEAQQKRNEAMKGTKERCIGCLFVYSKSNACSGFKQHFAVSPLCVKQIEAAIANPKNPAHMYCLKRRKWLPPSSPHHLGGAQMSVSPPNCKNFKPEI